MSGSSKPEASPPAGGDPSMEDILASIRRILSEDETPGTETAAATGADADVLVLDETMLAAPEPAAAAPAAPAAPPPVEPAAAAPPAAEPASPPPELPRADPFATEPAEADVVALLPPGAPDDLVGPEATAAAAASVAGLLRTIASDRALQVRTGGPTIEDIVRQTLRPLLKEWLDAHLPDLVERLVHAEIERVVNRALP